MTQLSLVFSYGTFIRSSFSSAPIGTPEVNDSQSMIYSRVETGLYVCYPQISDKELDTTSAAKSSSELFGSFAFVPVSSSTRYDSLSF